MVKRFSAPHMGAGCPTPFFSVPPAFRSADNALVRAGAEKPENDQLPPHHPAAGDNGTAHALLPHEQTPVCVSRRIPAMFGLR